MCGNFIKDKIKCFSREVASFYGRLKHVCGFSDILSALNIKQLKEHQSICLEAQNIPYFGVPFMSQNLARTKEIYVAL